MGYYSELNINHDRGMRANMGMYDDYSGNVDEIIEEAIKKYEAEHGEYDYYGFRNNSLGDTKKVEIYGVNKEELMKELEEVGERIINGEEKCYTIDELDEMLKKIINTSNDLKINIKENENDD